MNWGYIYANNNGRMGQVLNYKYGTEHSGKAERAPKPMLLRK